MFSFTQDGEFHSLDPEDHQRLKFDQYFFFISESFFIFVSEGCYKTFSVQLFQIECY